VGALTAGGWWAYQHRRHLRLATRLMWAKWRADQFYAASPHVHKNIPYHTQFQTRLDVYRPGPGAQYPVLFYVYGGAWRMGAKELYAAAAQLLMPHEVVLVIPNYTLLPMARFPIPTQQIAAALAWTLENIAQYGGDPRRVTVVAQSAGAQIAGVALFDAQWLAPHGHSVADIRGFLGISGVYNLRAQFEHERRLKRYPHLIVEASDGEHNFEAASPLTHTHAALPSIRLLHGDCDPTVPYALSVEMHQHLQTCGAPSDLITYRGGKHSELLYDALAQRPGSRLLADIVAFVKAPAPEPINRQRRDS
jgi:acetyl esterase/lipase